MSMTSLLESTGIIQSLIARVLSSIALVIIIAIGIFAVTYALNGFQNMYIGRKTGLDRDWMPFVPFAHTIYRLQMIDEQWWKMFFLEYYPLYAGILSLIINAISNGKWGTFAFILVIIYGGCCIAYRLYYRYKFYKAFDIAPVLCLLFLTPWFFGVRMLDLLIAFTNNYDFTAEGLSRTVSGTARAVVEVRNNPQGASPQAGQSQGGSITGLSGMYAGQDLPLADNEELVIGRDNALANLIIDQNASKVSRKHCSIVFDPVRRAYQVTDYSTNGTFVDGGNRLVANMPTTLQKGTAIALGSRENRFKLN